MLLGWAGMLVTQQDLIETHPYVSRLKSAGKVLKTWRDGERRFTGGGKREDRMVHCSRRPIHPLSCLS